MDIYGKVRTFAGRSLSDCPFRYQGQYEDSETGLYYNRFRYYSPEDGMYLSKDPIGLRGGWNVYAYVHDSNAWIDPLGQIKGMVLAGNTSGPSAVRAGKDITVSPDGMVKSQAGLTKPEGKSIFDNVENMSNVLKNTQVYEIKDSELPDGLGIIADGKEVGGHMSKGHHTIYPTKDMSFDEFSDKVNSLKTEHIGKINKDGNFNPKCP